MLSSSNLCSLLYALVLYPAGLCRSFLTLFHWFSAFPECQNQSPYKTPVSTNPREVIPIIFRFSAGMKGPRGLALFQSTPGKPSPAGRGTNLIDKHIRATDKHSQPGYRLSDDIGGGISFKFETLRTDFSMIHPPLRPSITSFPMIHVLSVPVWHSLI